MSDSDDSLPPVPTPINTPPSPALQAQREALASTWAAHVRGQLESIVASFRQTTELTTEFTFKEQTADWLREQLGIGTEAAAWLALDVAGLVVELDWQEFRLLALIPETVGLPGWFAAPDVSQEARLQTLAQEWSVLLLPEEVEVEASRTLIVPRMSSHLETLALWPDLLAISLEVHSTGEGFVPEGQPSILLLAPLPRTAAPLPAEATAPVEEIAGEEVSIEDEWEAASAELELEREMDRVAAAALENVADATGSDAATPNREANPFSEPAEHRRATDVPAEPTVNSYHMLQRLSGIKVQLSVRLAEKRMPLSALLQLGPGALVTFSKPCEDLLDIYIGNRQYAQGEAVKIGEHFGVKVNRLGPPPEKQSSLILD